MSDLISRQAAIDAMQDLPYGYRGMVRNFRDYYATIVSGGFE